jgi:hypothetical protein
MRVVDDSFVKKTTTATVGPGSYEITKDIDRKIYNPTIPRDGVNSTIFNSYRGGHQKKRNNNGSIKDNYDVNSSSDEEESGYIGGGGDNESAERRRLEK